jgi:hypothetical protein
VCALDKDKQGTAAIKLIKTHYYIDRIEFDLVDFQSVADSKFT